MNQNTFLSETYNLNSASNGKAILNIIGLPRVKLIKSSFSNNGEAIKSDLSSYGIIAAAPIELSVPEVLSSLNTYPP